MNFIQLNKFSELHDSENIFFCKTDYIISEFNYIKNLKNDIVLITGNSDYPITDELVSLAPKNIKKWFAQNAISNSEIIEPIPIGLENKNECVRSGHGIGYYDRVIKKENLLSRNLDKKPEKFIYSNFTIETNYAQRINYKKLSLECDFIDWEEPQLSLESFFDTILNYEMILCPIGNGVDTHRLWEVLYSNRIPIVVKINNYKIFRLYEEYPIIILDEISQLYDKDLLNNKLKEIKNKKFNNEKLDFLYWRKKIEMST